MGDLIATNKEKLNNLLARLLECLREKNCYREEKKLNATKESSLQSESCGHCWFPEEMLIFNVVNQQNGGGKMEVKLPWTE